ncbi:Hypothetical_protein [Hexamita inflata]|uniref:Hypothetical_protein n=1 Tax=Hexamita inflata TaxID=28002 RepID=A0AA86PSI5_9EUKA|nr:Hypothetical protein HINF_LOCUS32601 [Hexamita inflata]
MKCVHSTLMQSQTCTKCAKHVENSKVANFYKNINKRYYSKPYLLRVGLKLRLEPILINFDCFFFIEHSDEMVEQEFTNAFEYEDGAVFYFNNYKIQCGQISHLKQFIQRSVIFKSVNPNWTVLKKLMDPFFTFPFIFWTDEVIDLNVFGSQNTILVVDAVENSVDYKGNYNIVCFD